MGFLTGLQNLSDLEKIRLTPIRLNRVLLYIAFRKDRNCNGGGVAILIKSELVATEFNFLFVKRGLKTDLLSVSIPTLNFNITAIYHPYWQNSAAHDELLEHLNSIFSVSGLY